MELRQYATLVQKWWWLVLLGFVVAGAGSYYVSKSQVPVYRASVTLLVDQAQDASGPNYDAILASERLTNTYGELIRKTPVLSATIERVELPYTPAQLAKLIQVQVVRNTQLLVVSVDDIDPLRAQETANTLAQTFIDQRHEDQIGQLSASRGVLRQQIADLEKQLKDTSQALEAAKAAFYPNTAEITRLQNVLSTAQVTYSQLIKDDSQMRLEEARTLNAVRLAEPAQTPLQPISPKVLQNTLLAAVVGLFLALAAAFLIEYLDDTVKSGTDIERVTKLPTLGVVGRIPSIKNGTTAPRVLDDIAARSSLGESYRIVRANVDFAWAGQPGQLVMFTSTNPGEGKSTTLGNLATVFAKDSRTIIMVDCDLRRPSLHRAFAMQGDRGLTNLLADHRAKLDDYLVPTKQPNLWLLPSGPIPPNPSELLGSNRMLAILDELRQRADMVFIDTPPLLAVADPALLATRADGVILIVEAGGARVQSIVRANEVLSRTSARVLGVVLNKLSRRSSEYYYRNYHRYYAASPVSPNGSKKEPALIGGRHSNGGHRL